MELRLFPQAQSLKIGAVALALALSLAACSSSSPAVSPAKAGSAAVVQAGLLRLTDLPAGWVDGGVPSKTDSAQSAAAAKKIAECRSVALLFPGADKKKRDSHNFDSSKNADTRNTVNNSVLDYSTAASAKAEYASVAGSTVPTCLQKFLTTALQAAQTANLQTSTTDPAAAVTFTAKVKPLAFPKLGDESTGYSITLKAQDGGGLIFQMVTTLVAVRVQSDIVEFTTEQNTPLSAAVTNGLMKDAVDRLTKAMNS
jgi:hypothetical protein